MESKKQQSQETSSTFDNAQKEIQAKEQLLQDEQHSLLLLAIVLSMVVTPLLFNLALRLTQKRLDQTVPEKMQAEHAPKINDTVLIAGFGRFGEQIAKVLDAGGIPYIAVDNNPVTVQKAFDQSLPVYFGDVSRPNLLKLLNAKESRLAVITLDQPLAVEHAITALHTECPRVPIFARARDRHDSKRLHELGVETTVPETLESSLQLAASILFRLGIKQNDVIEIVDEFRDEDYRRMEEDTKSGQRQ